MTTHVTVLNHGPNKVKVTTLAVGHFAGTKSIMESGIPVVLEAGQFSSHTYVHSTQELLVTELPET